MPFITEEIWQKLGGVEPSIMVAPYPIGEEMLDDGEAERMIGAVKSMITTVRNARAERGFTPKERFTLYIRASNEREATFFSNYEYLLNEMARLDKVVVNGIPPEAARIRTSWRGSRSRSHSRKRRSPPSRPRGRQRDREEPRRSWPARREARRTSSS